MKHTKETLAKDNKETLVSHVLTLQEQATVFVYRIIAAVAAVAEHIKDGIKIAATLAVPAKSIIDQLHELAEYKTYKAACDAIDAENAETEKAFESSATYIKIKAAKENATKFEAENAEKIAKVTELNNSLLEIQQRMSAKGVNPVTMRQLRAQANEISEKLDELDAELVYPTDYADSFEALPTYTAKDYPNVDEFFPNGITGNFPASFLLASKKVSRPASASTSTSNGTRSNDGEKSEFSALPVADKKVIYTAFVKEMEINGGKTAEAITAISTQFPVVLTAPSSNFGNLVYRIKWQGSKEDGKVEVPVTMANYLALSK